MPDSTEFKPMIAEAVIRVVLGEADLRRHISDEDFVFAAIDLSRGLLHQQQLTGDALDAFVGRVEKGASPGRGLQARRRGAWQAQG
jgi:hypothetical protein